MNSLALAFLRIVPSALLIVHGFQKFQQIVQGNFEFDQNLLGIGSTGTLMLLTLGEFIAPIFLILGFQTRIAAIVAGFVMVLKVLFIYGASTFPLGAQAENSLLFLVSFIAIYMLGPGKYSLDKK